MKRRILSILLALSMVLTMIPAAFAVETVYSDTDGHWAESAIDRWSSYGIVEGNDGLFDPDGQLTRGQLATIIARLLNLSEAGSAGFADTAGHWAEDMINRCYAAGIMLGDGLNANPDAPITREETMVMLGRALGIKPVENADLSDYGDSAAVSDWAEGYVASLTDMGIVNGIDGSLAPDAEINRASTMTILNRAITTYVTEPDQTVEATDGIVVVAAANVTVTGEAAGIVVTQAAADGTTTLTNINVETVTVQAENTSVVVGENTAAVTVEVTAQATGTTVEVAKDAAVGTVTTAAAESTVDVAGTVGTVQTTETAANTTVETQKGATITNVENKADNTTVTGNGTVESVTTSGNNTTVETSGTKVEAAEGTTGTTAGGETVTGGSTATTTPTTPSTPTVPVHTCVVVSSVVTAPTCTERGYTTHTTCCGYSYVDTYVDALGHAWGNWTANDNGTHTRTCGNNASHTETEDCSYVDPTAALSTCTKCNTESSPLFSGGKGTENAPFMISTVDEWNNIYDVVAERGENAEIVYLKLANNIDFSGKTLNNKVLYDGSETANVYLDCFDLDGNGKSLLNIANIEGYWQVFPYPRNATIHDITIDFDINNTANKTCAMAYSSYGTVTFENVTVTGSIKTTGNWASAFVAYPLGAVNYINCTNNANLTTNNTGSSYVAPFGSHTMSATKVSFTNCVNNGTITGGNASGIVGMTGGNKTRYELNGKDAAVNNGRIYYAINGGHFTYNVAGDTFKEQTVKGTNASLSKVGDLTLTAGNIGSKLSLPEVEGAAKYTVSVSIATQCYNYLGSGKWTGAFPWAVVKEYTSAGETDIVFAYAAESSAAKSGYDTEGSVAYTGIYAPDGFSMENAEVIIAAPDVGGPALVKYNDLTFWYLDMEDNYHALLTTEQQADPTQTLTIRIYVTATDKEGVVLGSGSTSYSFTVEAARTALGGNAAE